MNWPATALVALITTLMFGSITVTGYARYAYAQCPGETP